MRAEVAICKQHQQHELTSALQLTQAPAGAEEAWQGLLDIDASQLLWIWPQAVLQGQGGGQ